MKTSPFFTIITASRNKEATIGNTLASVKNQNFQDLEHIVIDGGSQDATLNILERFENKYNLMWFSETDQGISDALNKGLQLSRGRYILVLHADDQFLEPNTLESTHHVLKSERFDICSFPVVMESAVRKRVLYKPIRIKWWYHFKTIFPHQGCFVHRRVFDRVGGFRKEFSIAMDYDFFYRILSTNPSVKFETEPIALMGAKGISNDQKLLIPRLEEEVRVQDRNESNYFWRTAQSLFRILYFPYKTRLLPKLRIYFG